MPKWIGITPGPWNPANPLPFRGPLPSVARPTPASVYSEFYCRTGGSNLNAGSSSTVAAVYTSAAGDSDGVSVFTPNDGSTPASSVNVGDFGSVYVTAGATVATFVGQVVKVAPGVNGAVTFSTTAIAGAFPANSAGAHTITLKVGGAWAGPNAAVGFPFNFVTAALVGLQGGATRVNLMNVDGTYSVTAGVTHTLAGPIIFQGCTNTPGDLGRFTLDGGATNADILTLSGAANNCAVIDAIFQNNTGAGHSALVLGTPVTLARRVTVNNVQGFGFNLNGTYCILEQCEAYSCNKSNTAGQGAVRASANVTLLRCAIHHNTGVNNAGVVFSPATAHPILCVETVFAANQIGVVMNSTAADQAFLRCEFYNNSADGFDINGVTSGSTILFEDCNFQLNGAWGINKIDSLADLILVLNCGFFGNAVGNMLGLNQAIIENAVLYSQDQTQDGRNGNFAPIPGSVELQAGAGAFPNTAIYTKTTTSFPTRSAVQPNRTPIGAPNFCGGFQNA